MTGHENLGRGTYYAVSILNPLSAAGKINSGVTISKAVTSTTKSLKAVDTATEEAQLLRLDLQFFAKNPSDLAVKGNRKPDVEVTIPSNRYPETSKHIQDAQKAGHPDTLTIDRSGAKLRRKDSLGGLNKVPGKDLDEYPPAMFKEGGMGASVRPVSPSDNRGAGAYLGNKLRNYPDGTTVRLK